MESIVIGTHLCEICISMAQFAPAYIIAFLGKPRVNQFQTPIDQPVDRDSSLIYRLVSSLRSRLPGRLGSVFTDFYDIGACARSCSESSAHCLSRSFVFCLSPALSPHSAIHCDTGSFIPFYYDLDYDVRTISTRSLHPLGVQTGLPTLRSD
jgi:hypothetical protein